MAVPHWQFILVRPTLAGNAAVAELTAARTHRLSWGLDDTAKVSWTIPGRHPQTALIDEMETDLVVARDGVAIFRGRINTSDDTLSENVHTCTFSATDYRGLLDRRIIWPGSTIQFTQADQAAIVRQLITETQGLGSLGIDVSGAANTGVKRDRTYEVGAEVGDLIGNLGRVINGFDWDISPTLALRIWYPARGSTVPNFVAEHGRNVWALRRTVSSTDFANAIRYSGDEAIPAATRVVTPGPEGRWERQYGDPDIKTAATLAETADGAIFAVSTIEPSYAVTLRQGTWSPGLVWLGDVIRLVARSGRLDVNTTSRVVGVEIDLGESGEEEVRLQLDRYRFNFTERLADYQYRLDKLERR